MYNDLSRSSLKLEGKHMILNMLIIARDKERILYLTPRVIFFVAAETHTMTTNDVKNTIVIG